MLPLVSLGAEHEFLGGSLIEELIQSHSKLSGLRVAGRSAVFQLLHRYLTGAAS